MLALLYCHELINSTQSNLSCQKKNHSRTNIATARICITCMLYHIYNMHIIVETIWALRFYGILAIDISKQVHRILTFNIDDSNYCTAPCRVNCITVHWGFLQIYPTYNKHLWEFNIASNYWTSSGLMKTPFRMD